MNYNFTGSITQRRINLGSANEITSTQLTQQAREERALRLEIRQRNVAATRIQSTYRGRKITQSERQRLRTQFQEIVADGDFVQATRCVALATRRRSIFNRLTLAGRAARFTNFEAAALQEDDVMLRSWATVALQRSISGDDLTAEATSESFVSSLQEVLRTILGHLRYQSASTQKEFQIYFDLFHQLITSKAVQMDTIPTQASKTTNVDWCDWLVRNAMYEALRAHLLSISLSTKAPSHSFKHVSELILQPLKRIIAASATDQHRRAKLIDVIIQDILSISDLPSRISRLGLTQMVVELPLLEIVERVPQLIREKTSSQLDSLDLLANILAIGWKRVPHFTKGAHLNAYLMALTVLQDNISSGVLQSTGDVKGKSNGRTTMERLDEELPMSHYSKSTLTNSTMSRLQILPSQDHISSILTISAKYASSTRESLCNFLVSTLQSWDPITRDHILACITYRHSSQSNGSAAVNRNAGISSHSIEGLVRELWRGWFRGSHLARFLSKDLLQGRKYLLAILDDEKAKSMWPCLLILCQLYSRSLLTIGDDEFYPAETSFSTSISNTSLNTSRNPLSIEEIIALSALLRNLAFSLYWYEGTGGALNDMSRNHVIGINKMDLLSLRDIVTRLLQQLHQRDSRRTFAPKDHWLMNSHLDLNSFIQSVVMEEQELNKHTEENGDGSHVEMDSDHDDDEDEMDYEGDEGISHSVISTRIVNRRRGPMRNGAANGGFSARSLAYLSPRLGILNNVPFMIPFEVRVEIFHQFTAIDYTKLAHLTDLQKPPREVSIRRSHVAEDGFTQLNSLGSNLKHRFAIKFIDQFGMEESGIDGGGLFKEFLTSLVKEAFDTDRGLWSATSDQQLYPNPHSYAKMDDSLQWYRFLGRILGKALYHGILVDVNFASFFLSKWLGKGNSYLDDLSGLESLDKEVYRNLLWLKHYTGDIEKDLSLDFTVTNEEFGIKQIHELIFNGRNVAVTRENRLEYIYRVSHYRLNEQIRPQSEAFLSGLTDVIDLRWLRMLNREELRILISGSEGEIDLEDLKKYTVLGNYHEKDEIMEYFWKSLQSFTHLQRKAFLKFVTSCPSPPLLGFSQLNPNFGIRNGGDDTTRLPSSSTCVNLLKLPRYTTYEQCREKLLYAIESGAGFDLS